MTALCEEILPRIAAEQVADAVDAYCETMAFIPAQVKRIFRAAQQYNLAVKLHADQLSDSNGALLAAQFKALSADHLEYANA